VIHLEEPTVSIETSNPVGENRAPELASFLDEQFISEVLRALKSGKEATAWVCRGGSASGHDLVVAKVYRPIVERGFKNDAVYQEGRWSDDRRIRRAFEQKSRAGRAAQFGSWIAHEFSTLHLLSAAGADVPRPIIRNEQAILMEYIGDEEGPAPLLQHVRLDRATAEAVFARLLDNVALFLSRDRVHGDLSPYNILYWQGRATIIDLPQAVDPNLNRNAETLLARDVANLCAWARRNGIHADAARISGALWMQYRFGR
jgi:RIO kinase 1